MSTIGHLSAPGLDDLAALAEAAFDSLPPAFRNLCADLLIRVDEFPSDEVFAEMGLESPFDLLGLYHGVDLGEKSVSDSGALPDMVFLYRRPILDYWCESGEELGRLVAHVLIHEIGHHFGLSDEEMEAVERALHDD